MEYSTVALMLIPAVLGYTEAVKTQFPAIKNFAPFVAIIVSFIMYYLFKSLSNDLFMTIYGAGASMGLYTGVKTLGTIDIEK